MTKDQLLTFPAASTIRTTAFWLRLESVFRQMGYDVYCAPSYAERGWCAPGKHPHGSASRHFAGRALDVGFDPPSGQAESDHEKAFLDVAVRMMEARYPSMGIVWNRGPGDHRDHAHLDDQAYSREGSYTGVPLPHDHVAFGMRGQRVEQLQGDLNVRGASLVVDGAFGLASFDALRRVQHAAGLVADGVAGPATAAVLTLSPTRPTPPAPSPTLPAPTPPVPSLADRARPFRIAGTTAYATAAALDRATLPSGRGVLLAARDTPDLVAAGAAAGRRQDVSVLPVQWGQEALPAATAARIRELGPDWLRVVGGPAAVPHQTVLAALGQARLDATEPSLA